MNELFLIVIIQICLESLPVSSSGHLMLISMLCQAVNGYSLALPEHFDHLLHGPTLIILGVFFFSSWWLMFKTVARSFVFWLRGKALPASHQKALMLYAHIVGWVICADLVTVFMYGVGKVLCKKYCAAMPTEFLLLGGLCVTMLVMLTLWFFERRGGFRVPARNDKISATKFLKIMKKYFFLNNCGTPARNDKISELHETKQSDTSTQLCHSDLNQIKKNNTSTFFCHPGQGPGIQDNPNAFGRRVHCVGCSQFSVAIILGLVQGFALIPGVSRFASTFVGARLFGMSARRAFATSFAMLAPLALAGFLFNGVRDLITHPEWLQLFTSGLLATMIFSTVGAYLLFVGAHRMACAQRLWWFGWYMLVPITALIALMVLR